MLVADRTLNDLEAVVGDEAHIAARSPGGPRYGECDPTLVDTYANLVLLCKVDHKIVDYQFRDYPTERLRRIKAEHEEWVDQRLGNHPIIEPIRIEDDPQASPLEMLKLIRTGTEVWNTISGAHQFVMNDLDEACGPTEEQLDVSAEFLQLATDWGEISGDVIDQGTRAVRDAKRSLT